MADQTLDPRFDSLLREALAAEAANLPWKVTADRVLERAASRRRAGARFGFGTGISLRPNTALRVSAAVATIAVLTVTAAVVLNFLVSRQGLVGPSPQPSIDLGIFERVAGWIVYGNQTGIWAVDPASSDPETTVQVTPEAGVPLGWSSDGTRLLIGREGQLFVLHADGSETLVAEGPLSTEDAAISPDGSRVVFADGGALYAIDADGGPAELLVQGKGRVEAPTFSPDGTQIAYDDGSGDNSHSVWLVGADGRSAHEIVSKETTACACHVYGLAWSPAGDRIALDLEGIIYTFAPDGSHFTKIAGANTTCDSPESCAVQAATSAFSPYWSPDGSQIAYTAGTLVIADADGSNARKFNYGMSGPWHPGAPVKPTTTPSPSPPATGMKACSWPIQHGFEAGTLLGCSSDGTRLLLQKGDENLFVLHSDGSETQVTEQLSGISRFPGSARPAGATISPDGSRVIFAGLTKAAEEARSCHNGALFAVDADGGPAELLWESPQDGIVRYPTFSPDGTQIAFADGYCDHDHSVWVMNADGSNAHQIVSNEATLGAGHVYGLAWSPAGDRIALSMDFVGPFTFATDGSDFTQNSNADLFEFCWPARQC